MYTRYIKRCIDVVFSFLGLLVLLLPMLVIAIVIKLDTPGPVFFKQKRVGENKKYFYIYKFRSMPLEVPKDVPTHLFNAVDMLTPWQRFMRKASLDELPQMINILKGDMSIVGPRPALWNQYDLIEERDRYDANDVKPGLTGWAQINGRDELDIPVKAQLDGEYVEKICFMFDVKCFLLSIKSVLKHDGFVESAAAEDNTAITEKDLVK